MANPQIKLKRSSTQNKRPTPENVPLGELALNTYDGYLYASKNVGVGTTVITVNPWRVGTGTDSYNIDFAAGNVGINSESPTALLDVNGDVNISGVVTATSFVKSDGTSSQFLKADGSVDSSTYLTSYTETDPVVAAINGIVKSNGSTISAASAGTDYLAPTGDGSGLSGIVTNIQAGANITILESPTGNFIVTSTASGVEIESGGTSVGTAITTINFSTNLTATASGGIATITASGGGGDSSSVSVLEVMLFT